MATTYEQQYLSIQNDNKFLGRITASAVQAAIAIYGEVNTTPGHAQRALYATKVMASPDGYARSIAWSVVSDPTIDSTASDAAIFSRLGAVWNVLAGV